MTAKQLESRLQDLPTESDPEQMKMFLRAYPGGYGEGDFFYGIRSGPLWELARQSRDTSLDVLDELLTNDYHESAFSPR